MTDFELYRGFIESVCHIYGIDDAIAPLQEGIKVLEEAHKDRTTGGNWFGKTLRDQNNFDRQLHTDSRHDIDPTKTAGITSRRYGFRKPISAGKGGFQYGLGNDGYGDTGDNTGMDATARRGIKRFQNREADKDLQSQLNDMYAPDDIGVPDNTYVAPTADELAASASVAPQPTTVADVAEVKQVRDKASKLANYVSACISTRGLYNGMPTDGSGVTVGASSYPTLALSNGDAPSMLQKWYDFQTTIDEALSKNVDPSLLGKIKLMILRFITFFNTLLAGLKMNTETI